MLVTFSTRTLSLCLHGSIPMLLDLTKAFLVPWTQCVCTVLCTIRAARILFGCKFFWDQVKLLACNAPTVLHTMCRVERLQHDPHCRSGRQAWHCLVSLWC